MTVAAPQPVQNLGVAGRGRARITPQPQQPSSTVPAAPVLTEAPPAVTKRSFADIMGGRDGAVTVAGFASDAMVAKKMCVEGLAVGPEGQAAAAPEVMTERA